MRNLIFFLFFVAAHLQAQSDTADVIAAVHDGDSYRFRALMDWVRIEGVDCPEVFSPYVPADQPYGRWVGDSVRRVLKGSAVTYRYLYTDRHNRPVVRVFVGGVDFAEVLLRDGLGWYWTENKLPRAVKRRYRDLWEAAKKERRGIFRDNDPTTVRYDAPIAPWVWRKMHPPIYAPGGG